MNHLTNTARLLLGVLAAIPLFAGCQREIVSNNPNFNKDENTVTAKFILNISTQTDNATKMTAENVQANNNNFLGMQDVHILTYKMGAGNTPSFTDAPATTGAGATVGKFYFNPAAAGKATADYNFGRLFDAGTIVTSGEGEKQSRVMELSFPLETNVVVLYGKALNTKGPEKQGKISSSGDPENLASLKFSLTPRVNKDVEAQYKNYTAGAYALQSILSSITIAGLVDELHYWTTDGKPKSANNEYQVTGTSNKQYKIWLPYEPNDPLYKKIKDRFTKPNTEAYQDGQALIPIEGDPSSNYSYTLKVGNCSWRMLGDMYEAKHDNDNNTSPEQVCLACDGNGLEFVPLLETLGEAYYKLLNIVTLTDDSVLPNKTYHELRAGSAAAILRTLRDLDVIVHKALNTSPSSWGEVVAQKLAAELQERLDSYFTGDTDLMVYKDADAIRTKLASYTNTAPGSDYAESGIATYFTDEYLQGTGSKRDGTAGFPMNIGFPMGAAYLKTETDGTGDGPFYFKAARFLFDENIPAYAFGSNETFNIFNYCYPAELMYYGNSPLRISSTEHLIADYPKKLADWKTDGMWASDWTKFGAVTSETRSVAMIDHINYGSALLKSTIQYDKVNTFTKLKDNNSFIHKNEQDNEIDISGTDGLIVTGIVIGGQPESVTWDYTRMPDGVGGIPDYSSVTFNPTTGVYTNLTFGNNPFKKMIYDKIDEEDQFRIGDATAESSGKNIVYTLCWDNYDALSNADNQSDVYIALELRNETGQDFWGETNLVRKGAIFYLVGKLDLASLITSGAGNYNDLKASLANRSKTGYYYYPPFDPTTGATIEVPRVFMQDYVTNATLVLKQDALKHAYMSVPDLRSNQVSLGVSVDIKWETGLSFEVNMGHLN